MNQEWWNQFVGVPFKEHGNRRTGANCWGLVQLVYSEILNMELPDKIDHGSVAFQKTSELIVEEKRLSAWLDILPHERADFDVVVLMIGGLPCHVGVVCNGGKHFLHVIAGANSVIENLDGLRWGGRIESYWRFVA
jgi:hypothetical protein